MTSYQDEGFSDLLSRYRRYWNGQSVQIPSIELIRDASVERYVPALDKLHQCGVLVDQFEPHSCRLEHNRVCMGRASIHLLLDREETAIRLLGQLRSVVSIYTYAWAINSGDFVRADAVDVDFLEGSCCDPIERCQWLVNGMEVGREESFGFDTGEEDLIQMTGLKNQKLWRLAVFAVDFRSDIDLATLVADLASQQTT